MKKPEPFLVVNRAPEANSILGPVRGLFFGVVGSLPFWAAAAVIWIIWRCAK